MCAARILRSQSCNKRDGVDFQTNTRVTLLIIILSNLASQLKYNINHTDKSKPICTEKLANITGLMLLLTPAADDFIIAVYFVNN